MTSINFIKEEELSSTINLGDKHKDKTMKTNVGRIDKTLRIVVGFAIIAAGVFFKSWFALIGVVLIATGLFNFCLLYTLFGINTNKE